MRKRPVVKVEQSASAVQAIGGTERRRSTGTRGAGMPEQTAPPRAAHPRRRCSARWFEQKTAEDVHCELKSTAASSSCPFQHEQIGSAAQLADRRGQSWLVG